jgi:aspartokinase
MWLTKYSQKVHKSLVYKRFCVDDFYVKKDISIIYMEKNSHTLSLIQQIYRDNFSTDHYIITIHWEREIGIIYDNKIAEKIDWIIPVSVRKMFLQNFSAVWIYLPEDSINEIWVIYTLSKRLNFNNINIVEMVSNYTEITFIINKSELKKSLEVLIH